MATGAISLTLPQFQVPLTDPINMSLSGDSNKKLTGKVTIPDGVKIDGVAGSKTTLGGTDCSVSTKDGKASIGGDVNILNESYTFKNGESISLGASVGIDMPLRYTIKFTGSDTKPNAIKFDEKESAKISTKGMSGSVTAEDPLFKDAGIFIPGFTKFKKWTQQVTITVQVTFEDDAAKEGGTTKSATLKRSIQWALRPMFEKKGRQPDDPDNQDPPSKPPLSPGDLVKIPIPIIIPLLFWWNPQYLESMIPDLAPKFLTSLESEVSSGISYIKNTTYSTLNDVAKAHAEVDTLSEASTEASEGLEAVVAEEEAATAGIEATEAGLEAAEAIVGAAETAEGIAAAEVAAATAAEAAAVASEAADWWTIIGGIISGAAIAAATAAVATAIAKHTKTKAAKEEAQTKLDKHKAELSKKQLSKKQAEAKKNHMSEKLKATQEKLKTAQIKKKDLEDVRDIWKVAHIRLEALQKLLKEKKK